MDFAPVLLVKLVEWAVPVTFAFRIHEFIEYYWIAVV